MEPDHLGERMVHAGGVARVFDAPRQSLGNDKATLDLRQQQNATIGGVPASVERYCHLLARHR